MLKMTGFDGLAKKMDEAAKALSNLDGEIATVSCDPKDPISIERAIQQVCATIEKKDRALGRKSDRRPNG